MAGEGAGQPNQFEVGSAVPTPGAEALAGVQPGGAALTHPVLPAETGAVRDAAAGRAWGGAASREPAVAGEGGGQPIQFEVGSEVPTPGAEALAGV